MRILTIGLTSCLALLFTVSQLSYAQQATERELLSGETWKEHGIRTIMKPWLDHGIDPTDGRFYAKMDRRWNPYGSHNKYPGMLSRHLFSLSAAFMLSGDRRYLQEADDLFQYLITHGWDDLHGGWYYSINSDAEPVDDKKDLFMNIYATAGLSMYYMATHNKRALDLVGKTRDLLRNKAWDSAFGGYYRRLNRAWEVTDSTKVFTPQVAPVSGYLLYLYNATRDPSYLEESEELLALTLRHMKSPEYGWIREKFARDWQYLPGNEQIDIGHNIEVSWMLLRLYAITGNTAHKKEATVLYNRLHEAAFRANGAWIHKMALDNPGDYSTDTAWWIQAYGILLQLPAYRFTDNAATLDHFEKGSAYWFKAFVDEQYGATILSADLEGNIDRGDKAVRTKTSYHAMELALLNYLTLSLWVENKEATLYFHFDNNSDSQPLCPMPIYDSKTTIHEISVNGTSIDLNSEGNKGLHCTDIPGNDNLLIKITLK